MHQPSFHSIRFLEIISGKRQTVAKSKRTNVDVVPRTLFLHMTEKQCSMFHAGEKSPRCDCKMQNGQIICLCSEAHNSQGVVARTLGASLRGCGVSFCAAEPGFENARLLFTLTQC